MALVIETGDGDDASANSYADLVFIRAYNTARGRTLSADDTVVNSQAILAMDYIEAQEPSFKGVRSNGNDQPLSWPRDNVELNGEWLASDEIPTQLKNAQAELVWLIKTGVNMFPVQQGAPLKRKKTGPLEKEWFEPGGEPSIPSVIVWLAPLMNDSGIHLRVERI